jgi:hypothetical protein
MEMNEAFWKAFEQTDADALGNLLNVNSEIIGKGEGQVNPADIILQCFLNGEDETERLDALLDSDIFNNLANEDKLNLLAAPFELYAYELEEEDNPLFRKNKAETIFKKFASEITATSGELGLVTSIVGEAIIKGLSDETVALLLGNDNVMNSIKGSPEHSAALMEAADYYLVDENEEAYNFASTIHKKIAQVLEVTPSKVFEDNLELTETEEVPLGDDDSNEVEVPTSTEGATDNDRTTEEPAIEIQEVDLRPLMKKMEEDIADLEEDYANPLYDLFEEIKDGDRTYRSVEGKLEDLTRHQDINSLDKKEVSLLVYKAFSNISGIKYGEIFTPDLCLRLSENENHFWKFDNKLELEKVIDNGNGDISDCDIAQTFAKEDPGASDDAEDLSTNINLAGLLIGALADTASN